MDARERSGDSCHGTRKAASGPGPEAPPTFFPFSGNLDERFLAEYPIRINWFRNMIGALFGC